MTLQNVRSLLWRGEDLGYGGGNTREQIFSVTVQAGARPRLVTQGFAGSVNVSYLLGTTVTPGASGLLRVLMNRSPDYFITLSAFYFNGSMTVPIQMTVPPLQQLYLPQNIVGPGTLAANSSWPIPLPPAGAGSPMVPLATVQNVLTFDWLNES